MHSRCAMTVTKGYIVNATGFRFTCMLFLSENVTFENLSTMKPLAAWDAVLNSGKDKILLTIFISELVTDSNGTHYTRSGDMLRVVFPQLTSWTLIHEQEEDFRAQQRTPLYAIHHVLLLHHLCSRIGTGPRRQPCLLGGGGGELHEKRDPLVLNRRNKLLPNICGYIK